LLTGYTEWLFATQPEIRAALVARVASPTRFGVPLEATPLDSQRAARYRVSCNVKQLDKGFAMARPFWRGQLRLALVTCPINLTPATTERDKIRFHKLNRNTGNRLRMQMIDSETQDVVDREQTVMGYEFEKGKYVTVESDEIEKLKIESSDVIDIERVVPADEIDWLFWEKPYILEPARAPRAPSTSSRPSGKRSRPRRWSGSATR
jgi:Ku70/Ku80-like protein